MIKQTIETVFSKLVDIALARGYNFQVNPREYIYDHFGVNTLDKELTISLLPNYEATLIMLAHEVGHIMTAAQVKPCDICNNEIIYNYESVAWDWAFNFLKYHHFELSHEMKEAAVSCLKTYEFVGAPWYYETHRAKKAPCFKTNQKNWS